VGSNANNWEISDLYDCLNEQIVGSLYTYNNKEILNRFEVKEESEGWFQIFAYGVSSELYNEALKYSFIVPVVQTASRILSPGNKGIMGVCTTTDKEKIKVFADLIDKYAPLNEKKYLLYKQIGIRTPEEILAEAVSNQVIEGNFSKAIELAINHQKDGYFEIIWELANSLHQHMTFDKQLLINLYKAITKTNSHYKEANSRLVILYPCLSYTKPYDCLEEQLKAAIESEDQTTIDQIFHQLCGNKGLNLKVTDVKGDSKTLIYLAEQIRNLSIENTNLKNENALLKKDLITTENEINKNKRNAFF
jgi:hypothetical protein